MFTKANTDFLNYKLAPRGGGGGILVFHNSNLFNSNDPYAFSWNKSKMCKQNVSCLVKDSELKAKKFNKIRLKDYSKSTKMAIIGLVSKFSQIFRGCMSQTPYSCIFLPQFASNLLCRKKTTLKNVLKIRLKKSKIPQPLSQPCVHYTH